LSTCERLIKTSELRAAGIPYGKARVMQLVAAGQFPPPIKLSNRHLVWRLSDLQAWISRIAERRAA